MKSKRLFGVPAGLAYNYFGGIGELLSKKFKLSEKIVQAGIPISPIGYGSIFAFYLIVICVPASAFAIFMALILKNYFLLTVTLAPPLICLLLFNLYPKFKADARRRALLAELPFIATYAGMMSLAGLSLYNAFERLSNQNVFRAANLEAKLILKEKLFFSKEPTLALELVASRHPSKEFRDYLLSYVRILRTGGSALNFLLDYSVKVVDWMRNALKRYAESARLYGDLMVVFFVFVPLGIFSIFSIMAPSQGVFMMRIYSFIVAPLSALGLLVAIDSEQFKLPQSYMKYMIIALKFALVLAPAVVIIHSYYKFEVYESLSLIVFASFLPPAIMHEIDYRKQLQIERTMPRFLRDIAEARKVGLSIEKALSEARSKSYGEPLDNLINKIDHMLRFSLTPIDQAIEKVIKEVESWFGKAMLWLFKEALISGGGSAETFSLLAKFSEDYVEVKGRISKELKPYCVIGYVTSLILLFVVVQLINYAIIPQVQLVSDLSEIYVSNLLPISKELLYLIISSSFTTIVVVSCLIGMIVGKIASGTIIGGFKHSAICTLIALIGIKGVGYFW